MQVAELSQSALLRLFCCWQATLLTQGLATGSQSGALQQELHSMHVPWLEVHAPGGLQVRSHSYLSDVQPPIPYQQMGPSTGVISTL